MTDKELRQIVLAGYYQHRKADSTHITPEDINASGIEQKEIYRISRHLHKMGLIEFDSHEGDDMILCGEGKITAAGVDAIESNSDTSPLPTQPQAIRNINTGGGSYVEGNAYVDGDFVGRDQFIAETINVFRGAVFQSWVKPSRYAEEQFKAYAEIWKSLQLVRFYADELWERATVPRMYDFARQLGQTSLEVQQGQLFFEEKDFSSLQEVLEVFAKFSGGKVRLLTYYAVHGSEDDKERLVTPGKHIWNRFEITRIESKELKDVPPEEAQQILHRYIRFNRVCRHDYNEILYKICASFKARLQQLG